VHFRNGHAGLAHNCFAFHRRPCVRLPGTGISGRRGNCLLNVNVRRTCAERKEKRESTTGLPGWLGLEEEKVRIDGDIMPADTYGLFACRGDMRRVRSKDERFHYYYIANWQQPARLCLMERGIRHARVLVSSKAPVDMITRCPVIPTALTGPAAASLKRHLQREVE
jgi:hypothetical protein